MSEKQSILEKMWSLLISNLGTKFVSVAIAVLLWFIVFGSRSVEVTKEIPLEVVSPTEIVPANEIPEKIAFRLSGPKAFLRAILDRREDPIRVNLSGAKPGLVTYRFFSDNIRIPIGVKVLSINPAAILIKLESMKRKDVPVKVDVHGTPPEGYRIVKAEVKPDVIRIKGAESRVDAITEVMTLPVDVSEIRQNTEKENIGLNVNRNNVQVESSLPTVLIQMEPISANFKIKNVDVRVLSNHKVQIQDRTVTILVRATQRDLKTLDRSRVYAEADLRGKEVGKHLVPVKVTVPENIGIVRVIPDKVDVTLY